MDAPNDFQRDAVISITDKQNPELELTLPEIVANEDTDDTTLSKRSNCDVLCSMLSIIIITIKADIRFLWKEFPFIYYMADFDADDSCSCKDRFSGLILVDLVLRIAATLIGLPFMAFHGIYRAATL